MNLKKEKGFSLIEILVVFGIFTFITISLLSSNLRSRVNINEAARVIMADIRTAQAYSLASKQYNGTHRCGYGIHQENDTSYNIYTGKQLPGTQTNLDNCEKKYSNSNDTPILISKLIDSRLEFFDSNGNNQPNFNEIFFDIYGGKIEIDGKHKPMLKNENLSQIAIRKKNASCPSSNCIYICVYSFGRIATRTDGQCPLCDGPADSSPAACQPL